MKLPEMSLRVSAKSIDELKILIEDTSKKVDELVEVGAGEEKFIGPFDPDVYNQTDGGKGHIYIDYSATENVEVAALLFPGK